MKAQIVAKLEITNKEDETLNDKPICAISYSNNERGDFNNFIDNLCAEVQGFVTRISSANELRINDQYIIIKGYSIKFIRDDETIIDEVSISNETVNEVDHLLTAFCCL